MGSRLPVVLVTVISVTLASPWKDCGSTLAEIKSVSLTGCSGSTQSCPLKKGTNETLSLTFTMGQDAKGVKAEVYGIIKGISVPFHLPKPDACEGSGLTCPLTKGITSTYTVELPILKVYPVMKLVIKWSLVDNQEDVVTCFAVPAEIVS